MEIGIYIDQTPGYTQVQEALKTSSEESDADSCRHQGYEYNYDAIDTMHDASSHSSNINLSDNNSDESEKSQKVRNKGGRPRGSTDDLKLSTYAMIARTKYKIVCRYINELDEAEEQGVKKRDLFNTILEEERTEAGLAESFYFSYETALSRIRRKSLQGTGTFSPLAEIEPQLVELVLCM